MFEFAISTFGAVFAIVNPIGNIPFFVMLTEGYTHEMKMKVIRRVVLVASLTLIIFALAGNYLFAFFHTSVPAFRIAGGLLLFFIAFSMMWGQRPGTKLTDRERSEALEKEVVGVVPLGIPMYAGPGAITTVVVFMADASSPTLDLIKVAVVLLAVIVTMLIAFILLVYGDKITARMGRMGALAFTRVMGLILASIAIQIIIMGFFGVIDLYYAR
jgi:multiple antibiotic resistance protein